MYIPKKIDLVIVSSIRPDILQITLNSFKHKLLHLFDVRVILNVDPIGESHHTQSSMVDICNQYFDKIIYRLPEIPSFSSAVQWCWSQVNADFFFHLEDDWCLRRKIDACEIMEYFQRDDVVSVRLNLNRNSKFTSDRNGVCYSNRLSLNPSMFRTSYIKELLCRFDTNSDPEKQFSKKNSTLNFPHPKFVIYGHRADKSTVIDTGKKWRRQVGLKKWDTMKRDHIAWKKQINYNHSKYLRIKYQVFLIYWSKVYCKNLTITPSGLHYTSPLM